MNYKKQPRVRRQVSKYGIEKVVQEKSASKLGAVSVRKFKINDGYHQPRYKLERAGSRLFAASMETYLAKRKHYDHAHPKNMARKILYSLPSFSAWAALMPGSLALEPVHHPEQSKLPTGKRLDPITRRLFRHGMDPIGVRTRTLMGGWLARQYVKNKKDNGARWLSLAGGTSVPSMIMVEASRVDKSKLFYSNVDLDGAAIEIAREVTELEGLKASQTRILAGDIFTRKILDRATDKKPVDIIDMMGIFEYFEDKKSAELLKLALEYLKTGGLIIAGNMRSDHPQLNLHKRGVGWPDVIPRSESQVISICRRAGISESEIDIYQPADGVYSVFRVTKT